MSEVLTEADMESFEHIFTPGTWVLIKEGSLHPCVGTFSSQQDAASFRDAYLPDYFVAQMTDPEDMIHRKITF